MGRLKATCGLEEEANVKSGSDVYLGQPPRESWHPVLQPHRFFSSVDSTIDILIHELRKALTIRIHTKLHSIKHSYLDMMAY